MNTNENTAVAGRDFDQAPWPVYQTVERTFSEYLRERLQRRGKDIMRAGISFNYFLRLGADPLQDVTTISIAQVEDYVGARVKQGRSILTPRKDLAFVSAAIHWAHRRHRIKEVPYIELPAGQHKHRRPLRPDEYALVMKQPMSARLRRFYRIARWTGARAEAIEELTWDRVDFVARIINFAVPGAIYTNKRRVENFPIPDEALPILAQWKLNAKDEFVIGAGSTTYVEAAKVVRELAGLTDPSLVPRHCMRKMFTTELVEKMIAVNGHADMKAVSALTGDTEAVLTKHYVEQRADRLRAAANMQFAA